MGNVDLMRYKGVNFNEEALPVSKINAKAICRFFLLAIPLIGASLSFESRSQNNLDETFLLKHKVRILPQNTVSLPSQPSKPCTHSV